MVRGSPVRDRVKAYKKHGRRGPYKTKLPKRATTLAAIAWLDRYPYLRRHGFQIGFQVMHPLYDDYTDTMYNTGLFPEYTSSRCPGFRKHLAKNVTRHARKDSGIVQPQRRQNVSM